MKRLVLVGFAAIVAVEVCAPLYAQDAANGKKVFDREKCVMCHTATRNSLSDVGSKLTADQIRDWIKNPVETAKKNNVTMKPQMKSFASLSQKDVDDLVAYLQTMKAAK